MLRLCLNWVWGHRCQSKAQRILGDLQSCLHHLLLRQMGFIDVGLYFFIVCYHKLNQARRPERRKRRFKAADLWDLFPRQIVNSPQTAV